MKKTEIDNIKNDLHFGIHTLQVFSSYCNNSLPWHEIGINSPVFKLNKYSYIINPEKVIENKAQIYTYSNYKIALDRALFDILGFASCGDSVPILKRIDFRLDSFSKDSYDKLFKLNRILLSMIAFYNRKEFDNSYYSIDFIGGKVNKTQVVKSSNNRLEFENYNKALETVGGTITNRFEFRVKGLTNSIAKGKNFEYDYFKKFRDLFDNAITEEQYSKFGDFENNLLIAEKEELYKNFNIKYFFMCPDIKLRIFSPKQAKDLYKRLAKNDVSDRTIEKNLSRYGITNDLYTFDKVKRYKNIIINKADKFFKM